MMFGYRQPAVEAKSEDDGQMDGRPCVTRYQDSQFSKRRCYEDAGKVEVKERYERSFPLAAEGRCLMVVSLRKPVVVKRSAFVLVYRHVHLRDRMLLPNIFR